VDIDLSEVSGLDTAIHRGPSSIGLDTLYKSQGRIPDRFLHEAGVPDEITELVRSIRSGPAIQWHSCETADRNTHFSVPVYRQKCS